MENFKQALIQFAHSNPSLFPSDTANSYPKLIKESFHQFFPDFQTPNHPPYAAMIYKAIQELNKKRGSSEKSISKFIKKEYADLPWAHSTLLKHHLEKLCDLKEICMTEKQCYLLAGAESEEAESVEKSTEPSKKCKKNASQSGSEAGKKSNRPHKKYKKIGKCGLVVQETSEQEQIGKHKRKRKQLSKAKKKSGKRLKKHAIKEPLEVKMGDIQNHEQNEPLQPEGCPDLSRILHANGKRVCTRARSKTVLIKVKSALEPESQQISTSPTLEKPLTELIKPISSKLMSRSPDDEPTTGTSLTEVQDLKDQQPEKSKVEVKRKYKGRGRPPKLMKSQKAAKKGKIGKKKVQLKHKRDGGRKKTRRSS